MDKCLERVSRLLLLDLHGTLYCNAHYTVLVFIVIHIVLHTILHTILY